MLVTVKEVHSCHYRKALFSLLELIFSCRYDTGKSSKNVFYSLFNKSGNDFIISFNVTCPRTFVYTLHFLIFVLFFLSLPWQRQLWLACGAYGVDILTTCVQVQRFTLGWMGLDMEIYEPGIYILQYWGRSRASRNRHFFFGCYSTGCERHWKNINRYFFLMLVILSTLVRNRP